jgi:hypothetical protein
MTAREFDAVLFKDETPGASTFIEVPFSVPEVYGVRGVFRVKGTADGVEYSAAYAPYSGRHWMVVRKDLMDAIGKGVGDSVHFVLEPDTAPRVVTPPDDFAAALSENDIAQATWDKLAYSHKKEFVSWIDEAKKRETRDRRIAKAVEMIAEGLVRKK